MIEKLEREIRVISITGVLAIFLILALFTFCVKAEPVPTNERQVIEQVADEYKLEGDERTLLTVIRIVENGAVGREFGVLTPQAMRYTDNPQKSLITQARWAAGTIKKRYNGNLKAFADRYCPPEAHPLNNNWYKNAKYWMDKLKGGSDVTK